MVAKRSFELENQYSEKVFWTYDPTNIPLPASTSLGAAAHSLTIATEHLKVSSIYKPNMKNYFFLLER